MTQAVHSISQISGIQEQVPLAPLTTFRIGGPARYFLETDDTEKITMALQAANRQGLPVFVLGGGSNIVVSDQGFAGIVIRIADKTNSVSGVTITAGSGALLQSVASAAVEHSLTGMEFCAGIPGTVGGAITGNAGTASDWIGSRIQTVQAISSQAVIREYSQADCCFGYRNSIFKQHNNTVITAASFALQKGDATTIRKKQRTAIARRSQQPKNVLSAGSVFRNPETMPAWKLIDDAGLRGKKIGGAMVSEEHTNYIINTGEATAEDVVTLISYIKQQVRDTFNIQLMEEVEYIGFD